MYREGQAPPSETLNIFLNAGGLGDNVAALPAVLAANKQNAIVTVWTPHYFTEFAKTILPNNIIVKDFKDIESRDKYSSSVQTLSGDYSPMRMHLTDYACSRIIDKFLDNHEKNYLKFPVETVNLDKFNLPEKFIILTPGFTAPVREWQPGIINAISDYILLKGYTPVFLGTNKTLSVAEFHDGKKVEYKGNFDLSIDYSKGLNLVNKTNLSEACSIMSKAKVVVGLDNGLLHLAGCTDVAIVGGFTTVEPKYRMPYRNNELGWNYHPVVPPESLGCRFCQSNWSFVYDFDFKKCWYKDYKCVRITDEKLYIEQLEKLI